MSHGSATRARRIERLSLNAPSHVCACFVVFKPNANCAWRLLNVWPNISEKLPRYGGLHCHVQHTRKQQQQVWNMFVGECVCGKWNKNNTFFFKETKTKETKATVERILNALVEFGQRCGAVR